MLARPTAILVAVLGLTFGACSSAPPRHVVVVKRVAPPTAEQQWKAAQRLATDLLANDPDPQLQHRITVFLEETAAYLRRK